MAVFRRPIPTILLFLGVLLSLPPAVGAYFSTFHRLSGNMLKTTDWTAPNTTLFLEKNGVKTPVGELIVNGTFTDGTNGWTTTGIVTTQNDAGVQLGSSEDISETRHTISQIIPNTAPSLTFMYQVFTTESLPGFDDPAFEVRVNNTQVLQVRAEDIVQSEPIRTTGLKKGIIDLSPFTEDALTITFAAGNTGDAQHPSWAQLQQVSTAEIVANPNTLINFQTDDTQASTHFFTDIAPQAINFTQPFTLENLTSALTFWSTDVYANSENQQTLAAHIDATAPETPLEFSVTNVGDGEYKLIFTTPHDNLGLARYDIGIASPLAQTPESAHAPLPEGTRDVLYVSDVSANPPLEFFVRAIDPAGNISEEARYPL